VESGPYYGIESWQATGLVLVAYVVVRWQLAIASLYNRTIDRREAQARGGTETGTSTV
jgi:hypothetical protein